MRLQICQSQRADTNINKVALSGGCWQNVLLFNKTVALLKQDGFEVYTNRKVPVNDGGLSFGQAVVAAAIIQGG